MYHYALAKNDKISAVLELRVSASLVSTRVRIFTSVSTNMIAVYLELHATVRTVLVLCLCDCKLLFGLNFCCTSNSV